MHDFESNDSDAASSAERAREAYARGPESDLGDLRLDELLERAAALAPERDALVFLHDGGRQERWTYRELAELVDSAASSLVAVGIGRADAVAIYPANRPEFVVLQLACARIGAALVPVNAAYTPDELADVLRRSNAGVCFVGSRDRDRSPWDTLAAVAAELPELRLRIALDARDDAGPDWSEWLAQAREADAGKYEAARRAAGPGDIIQITFTSGTTGRPKGVRLRSAGYAHVGRYTARGAGLEAGCRYVHAMPFYGVGGTIAIAACLAQAGTQVTMPRFSASATAAAIVAEQATTLHAVPTMMIATHERAVADGLDLSCLRTVITGGALVPEHTARQWIDAYAVVIANIYGMTETTGTVVQTGPADPLERALASVGCPLPGTEVDIVEPGTDRRVPAGAQGEIRFRGWGVMAGYQGDPDATARALSADGWLRSGDLGVLDRDGYLRVTGRAKDVIIRGGMNVAPASIEDAIRELVPEAADASVIGVPDAYYGEVVVAYVRLLPGAFLDEEGLKDRLRGRIADYRVPAFVRFVAELPTTPSGKVQKFRLREWFAAEEKQSDD